MDNEYLKEKYTEACKNNPVVHHVQCLIDQSTMSEIDGLRLCICILLNNNSRLQKQLTKSIMLEPRRIKLADGSIKRFDIPDEFVPIVEAY